MAEIAYLENVASQVRRDILRQVHACASGHPGASLGCAEFFVALYFEVMHHDTSFNMKAKGEDVFFLSNGHISPVFYSTLARRGYFEVAELATFRKLNSRLQGHPATHEGLPGIRVASGSLGQGISVAIGVALAKKLDGDDKTVFVLTGDGELQEGQIWEAAMFAPHNKLDNLIVTIDLNGRQIDGDTKDVLNLGDVEAKWKSFGWDVMTIEQGNHMADVVNGLKEAKSRLGNGKPVCILLKTEMGYPIDFMVGTHKWHGAAPNDDQLAKALAQLEETLGDY
ncbi:MAG TPA: transketolase [Saprospiraceae bacterium]|nr:transketolase [Saprospiraceae bacterium]